MMRSCSTCEYSQAVKDADYGECRRHAPPAISFRDAAALAIWPRVKPTDWCGDYETRRRQKRRAA